MSRPLFLIVDGNSLMHRAYHALPPMDANGVPTNAVHGFLMMLLKVLQTYEPAYCAAAFDEHAPTFRHRQYAEYKAGRQKTPDDLVSQFGLIRELLPEMHIPVLAVEGYEADDILGTVSRLNHEQGIDTMLLTGDRDALQLVSGHTRVLFTRKGISETVLFTPEEVKNVYGITPAQVIDWKGLSGDASDNIPGIPGIGDKTAVRLLEQYGTLDETLAHAGEIKGKLGEKLREFADQGRFSRDLARICLEAPVTPDYEASAYARGDGGRAALRRYQLNAVLKQAEKVWPASEAEPEQAPEEEAPAPEAARLKTAEDIRAWLDAAEGDCISVLFADGRISLSSGERFAEIPLAQSLLDTGLSLPEASAALKPLASKKLVTHDAKRLLHRFDECGLGTPEIVWDTMLAEYLKNPLKRAYALENYARADADGVRRLSMTQRNELSRDGMVDLCERIELPLSRVLFEMEKAGFLVDRKVLEELGEQYRGRIEALKADVYRLTGVEGFNLNSPQQLGHVLFEVLGLRAGKKTQRGYSTDAETLEGLADDHPAIEAILEYRTYVKFNGTYIDGLLDKIDATGRVHSFFDQVSTATGRISSSEPNLQNIPVRSDLGREIRRAFIAPEGCLLVDADYSQIELRVLAHMSGDEAMIDAFRRGQDIHARTAAEVYGVPIEEVTHTMRSNAKAVNFGIVYGISDFGLARNIHMSRREAGQFIGRYLERYPGIHQFMERMKQQGHERGYAETLFGRRRPLPELREKGARRSFGERVAMNMPVQGTAADIIKLAMVQVSDRLRRELPECRLILQVHDELLIEAPESQAAQASALLRETMEQVTALQVPLLAEVKTGKSWFETK